MSTDEKVAIIGTGDFGRALGKILVRSQYDVVFGSRNPSKVDLGHIDEVLGKARVTTVPDCVRHADVVFLCVNRRVHHELAPLAGLLSGKILVDVSNYSSTATQPEYDSLAEVLQRQFPETNVVKAFNTLSAYRLESEQSGERRLVYVAGNSAASRDRVKQLVRNLGLVPIDCGGLVYSRELEAQPHQLLKGWMAPSILTLILAILWLIWVILRYYVLRDNPYTWDRFATNTLNKWFACLSMTLLALVYLPGCFAAYSQLLHGTKYYRFSGWLDSWMQMRKMLGLYALLTGCLHCVLSVAILKPAYFSDWFHYDEQSEDVINGTVTMSIDSRMNWIGEWAVLFGFLATASMILVGITTLPSVGNALNWREWRVMQSYMGWFTLLLSVAHVMIKGLGYSWVGEPFGDLIQKLSFLACIVPWFAILLKIFLIIPCVDSHLWRIRHGYERGNDKSEDNMSYALGIEEIEKGKVEPRNGAAHTITNGDVSSKATTYQNEGYTETAEL